LDRQCRFHWELQLCRSNLWDAEPGNPVPSLTQHFLIVPLGMVILMVPLFPGGAGIGELGYGGLYACSSARRRTAFWLRW
jgi:hypothetical protein